MWLLTPLFTASFLINFFYRKSRLLFNSLSSQKHTNIEFSDSEKDHVAKVRDADGFIELCELWNEESFRIEEHVVQTRDGYLLGLHRIFKKTPEEDFERSRRGSIGTINGAGNGDRKVVYLHHGLLMNSEVWVCQLDKEDSLPYVLANKGFDVWVRIFFPCSSAFANVFRPPAWEQPRQQVFEEVYPLSFHIP